MTVHVHIFTFNEAPMIAWALTHYSVYADRIFVEDGGSSDDTERIAAAFPKAVFLRTPTAVFREQDQQARKTHCWKRQRGDWTMCVDADEFVWCPSMPVREALEMQPCDVVRTFGYNMIADALPPHRPGDYLHRLIRTGAPDSGLCSKPCVFNSRSIAEINFGIGAHDCAPVRIDGGYTRVDWSDPPLYLLHFKFARGIHCLVEHHRAFRERVDLSDKERGWNRQTFDESYLLNWHRTVSEAAREFIPADVPW